MTGCVNTAVRVSLFALCAVVAASATPYWFAYEGDDLPQNHGWGHARGDESGGNSGAVCSVADGILTIDSLRSDWIYDFFYRYVPAEPNDNEMFVAEWRVAVDPRSGDSDVSVGFAPYLSWRTRDFTNTGSRFRGRTTTR